MDNKVSRSHAPLSSQRNRRPERDNRPNDRSRGRDHRGSAELTVKEAEALGVLLEHMGQEVLIRSEADPKRPAEEIIADARKETLSWLAGTPLTREPEPDFEPEREPEPEPEPEIQGNS